MSETVTASIRRRVAAAAGRCPTCGQSTNGGSVRQIAEEIGVPHTVLWRFLRGSDITGRTLDKIAAWLDGQL